MESPAFEKGVEVRGSSLQAIFDAFQSFAVLASEYLIAEGVGRRGDDGLVAFNPAGWYPLSGLLRASRRIGENVGEQLLFGIGAAVPRHALFPPFVQDVPSALQSVNVAYHLNHRKDGVVMYDAETGRMAEGIGHYGYERVAERSVVSVCENPYPCAFDHGLLSAMAQRFAPLATVVHDAARECRQAGGKSCTFVISW